MISSNLLIVDDMVFFHFFFFSKNSSIYPRSLPTSLDQSLIAICKVASQIIVLGNVPKIKFSTFKLYVFSSRSNKNPVSVHGLQEHQFLYLMLLAVVLMMKTQRRLVW